MGILSWWTTPSAVLVPGLAVPLEGQATGVGHVPRQIKQGRRRIRREIFRVRRKRP